MVLAALLILTAVSIVVVTMSVANIRMSSRYNNWSKEYYTLDYATQERLITFDSGALVPAENMARYYLQNNYYAYATATDFPGTSGIASQLKTAMLPSFLQEILHARMLEISAVLEPSTSSSVTNPEETYNSQMATFTEQTLRVLYYYFVDKAIPVNTSAVAQPATNGIGTTCTLNNPGWFPAIAGDIDTISEAIKTPEISIKAVESASLSSLPKTVAARISLAAPQYQLVQQTSYQPVKINPLYTNAISAQGSITFEGSGTVSITGDVVSSNNTASKGLPEGNLSGVKTDVGSSANVNIYGNVYSAGDVHLWGNNSSISVRAYADSPFSYTRTFKDLLYQNQYYYADGAVSGDSPFREDVVAANGSTYLPYIYKDSIGGNVYCNNLSIENAVTAGTLAVAGDLWTQDDIQNDGGAGAGISVAKNFIGMSSDATNGDPNGSSAVINNATTAGGTISIAGDYLIPGTAFYKFDGGEDTAGSGVAYYQTAESGNARTISTFTTYFATGSDPSTTYFADTSGDEQYTLYTPAGLEAKIARFKSDYTNAASGISVKDNANYYSLGVVVDSTGAVRYTKSPAYIANYLQYSAASGGNVLKNVFNTKTQRYGTPSQTFEILTNTAFAVADTTNRFYYLSGASNTVTVGTGAGELSSGIIYSNGDLSVTGSGEFHGTIVCRGNLTVHSGVSIVHDEQVIKQVLGVQDGSNIIPSGTGSRIAREFFTPLSGLALGKDLATEQINTVSTVAGERSTTGIDRYTIKSWKESHA